VIPMSPGNYNQRTDTFECTRARIDTLEQLAQGGQVDLSHSPKWREQLGSLGGGNHFIELCADELNRVWMFLHSGSRGVGNKIAQRHIKIAKQLCKMWHVPLPSDDLAFLPQGTPEFTRYIKEMNWAQVFALTNREEMMDRFRCTLCDWIGFGGDPAQCEAERINCHHNYTKREYHGGRQVWVTRKGAIEATSGQWGLIPGSMGTRSYVVVGVGNAAALHSAPHGAGRQLSRKQAKAKYTHADLADLMMGIEYRPGDQWVDEIPLAYKPIDVVMRDSSELVDIRHELRQLLNCKGE
jgi:tRNA-splicing ligase RtcB